MLKLNLREQALFWTALLLLIFGLIELSILVNIDQKNDYRHNEANTNSRVAITVAAAISIAIGLLCLLYAAVLTQKVWMKPTPIDPQVLIPQMKIIVDV